MSPEQRGYLFGEVYRAIAEGIDILLERNGHQLALLTVDEVHEMCKQAFAVESTRVLSDSAASDYIATLHAFAAECLIFVGTPEEWQAGTDWAARRNHYNYVLRG